MPMYKALVKCFVDNSIREEGGVFEYNGDSNACVELVTGTGNGEPTVDASGRKWKTKGKRVEVDDTGEE